MTTTGAPADLIDLMRGDILSCLQDDMYFGDEGGADLLSDFEQAVRIEAVGAERTDIAAKLRANEALLNEFAKDGSVAGLIAFLIESLTVAASDSPPGAVGLGLVPPGPNPADKEGNS